MAALALTPSLFDQTSAFGQPSGTALLDRPSGGATLEDLITAAWREVTLGSVASCPVCHGELRPVREAGSRPVGGRCEDCGTRLN